MDATMKKMMTKSIVLGLIFVFVTNTILARFMTYMNVYSGEDVAELVGWLWLGFTLPVVMTGYIWEKKSLSLTTIAAGQTLVSMLAGGLVLLAMA